MIYWLRSADEAISEGIRWISSDFHSNFALILYEGKPCNTSLGTTEVDNLYYVKLSFADSSAGNYNLPSNLHVCNVYVRLRAAFDFQQVPRCPKNNDTAALVSFSL
jgi:hypothetical protein